MDEIINRNLVLSDGKNILTVTPIESGWRLTFESFEGEQFLDSSSVRYFEFGAHSRKALIEFIGQGAYGTREDF